MKANTAGAPRGGTAPTKSRLLTALVGSALLLPGAYVQAVTLNVVGVDNSTSPPTETALAGYRWLVEEDRTSQLSAGAAKNSTALSFGFHASYMPVVANGTEADTAALAALDPGKRYFVSVMPDSEYSIGGANIKAGQSSVTVYVNKQPIPTAQIAVFVHEDIAPINNVWDEGELGLGGASIILEDAGGKYGASAGIATADAFGNPLCTEYQLNPDDGTYVMGGDGLPVVSSRGAGCVTGPDGRLVIKHLAPAKYGIIVVPPGGNYIQTSTIEGTKLIDAWVKANEPPWFGEFGPPGPHVAIGFVPLHKLDTAALSGGANVSGQVVNLHLSRAPDTAFYNGGPFPHTTPWVGLNQGAAGAGHGVYAAKTNDDGSFSIAGVPPGDYELVVWDDNLDLVFATYQLTVNEGGSTCNTLSSCNLGDVPVFQWFARLENWVFNDEDEDGFRGAGEQGLLEQAVNLRFRDGTLYQSMPTDLEGFVPFDQVFPFFSWLVAEVDFARFKATGATITVDDGGAVPFGNPWAWGDQLSPQPQSENGGLPYRTETGPVLTQAFQAFLGQTNVIEWGKKAYLPGENGGVSGMVFYAVTRAEDDPELAAAEPWEPGIPGVTVNLYAFDKQGDEVLVGSTVTDSWDASLPTNCQGDNQQPGVAANACFDGMRNWNQVRPGVFDGGFAFDAMCAKGTTAEPQALNPRGDCPGDNWLSPMPVGKYLVEVVPPAGYQVIQSQDRNVDFGDSFFPTPDLQPPPCAGADYTVPAELSLFPGEAAPLAGQTLAGCERKLVTLKDQSNAAAEFSLFTDVPIAGHIFGMILDDLSNEFDPSAPTFGEKYAPPGLPVSIRDWTGREIARTYADKYGRYNAMVPSTYTQNLPMPSGTSPNMLTTCMNSQYLPGPDGLATGGAQDPNYNPQYSEFCYTFQYMPGSTTYLDTPVVPVAAFAGPGQDVLDCEYVAGTPRIHSVTGTFPGPYVAAAGGTLTITPVSGGARDQGFGCPATAPAVTIGGVAMTDVACSGNSVTGTVAAGTATGQLVLTRGDNGNSTVTGVTVHVGGTDPITVAAGGSIQDAIDMAASNDLILVAPGLYREMVIMHKPVKLQGAGEGSVIDALKQPFEKLVAWRQKVESLYGVGAYDLVPGQGAGFGGIEPDALFAEEGTGVLVLGPNTGNFSGARIDGFTITGADTGGAVVVNGYAHGLEIANNRMTGNTGFYGGGVRVGHLLEIPQDGINTNVSIHHNQIVRNGGLDGAGGGVTLFHGSDEYEVADNFICGNFTLAHGAGIGHYGRSDNGRIAGNKILFNENFNQMVPANGGGILISGQPGPNNVMLASAGSVTVEGNLVQGNSSGSGDGGGLRLNGIFGGDSVDIVNNMIVNNVAALAGGGVSLLDAAAVIVHNTIAHNDSTATAGSAFAPPVLTQSLPQKGAGIIDRGGSTTTLQNNIVWENRSFFFFQDDSNPDAPVLGLCPNVAGIPGLNCPPHPFIGDTNVVVGGGGDVFHDLSPDTLTCIDCVLTASSGDPQFVDWYFNGARESVTQGTELKTAIQPTVAFDEGGTFVRVRFGPLSETNAGADYHITAGSSAEDLGSDLGVTTDFDGDTRATPPDIGADEIVVVTP